jgi:hypothetical protein
MARTTKKKAARTASFDGVGKGFAAEQEYLVKVKEVEVEEGDNGLYYAVKLEGTGEFEGSLMYHNASLSPAALWRTRDFFEAFLGEVPDGDFDVDEYAAEFVGKTAMCNTYKSEYNGKTSIKPEDFWAAEGADDSSDGGDIDLDDIDDDDIKKLAKALGIKAKKVDEMREKIAEADSDDVEEAMRELGLLEEPAGDEGGEDIDFDAIEDDDIKALGKKMGIKAKKPADIREALAEEDAAEVKEAMEGLGIEVDGADDGDEIDLDSFDDDQIKAIAKAAKVKGKKVKDMKAALAELDADDLKAACEEAGVLEGDKVSADDIQEMGEDELEKFLEDNGLEVDLDEHKTLRKKRAAVVDAAEEAGLLE